ncbi:helix-turn-helix domain-containing protein [Streptomyces sp. NPDC059582]|uniref:helix-turn-helix domain-containing protein n=1 Tax=Streptomyces sp. NPDC059582 TaxID=3346875 RepID=UPI0036AB9919
MSRLPDGVRREVEALLCAGHSDWEVHRRTGAARRTIRCYRMRLGLPVYMAAEDSPACRHGHPFPENVARYPSGGLYCLACAEIRKREYHASNYEPVQPDEVAIERAVAGDPARLTPRERSAAIAQLDAWQLPASVIAERVRCSPRTVHRARSRQRAAV